MGRQFLLSLLLVAAATLVPARRSSAIVFYGSGGDGSGQNLTAPTGYFASSGWQFEGNWGVGVGTPIAPNLFITANHLGGSVGTSFIYNGQSYTTTASYNDPGTDVTIWKVQQQFSTYAPIYQGDPSPTAQGNGQMISVFGRGLTRGGEITGPTGAVQGYNFGNYTGALSFGVNQIAFTTPITGFNGNFLGAYFANTTTTGYFGSFTDPTNGRVYTSTSLSAGDSGGGSFVRVADGHGNVSWQLVGINYGVDGPFSDTTDSQGQYNNFFNASLFDKRGYYDQTTGSFTPANSGAADPGLWVASELYDKLDFINATIAANAVPEPSSVALLGVGLAGFAAVRLRRSRARASS